MGPQKVHEAILVAERIGCELALKWLLLETLPKQHKEVYWRSIYVERITSADVERELGIRRNHAGNILKNLARWGILARYWDDSLPGFVYKNNVNVEEIYGA